MSVPRSPAARRIVWIMVAVVAALAGVAVSWLRQQADPVPRDASTLLAVSLPDVDGRDQPLAQWKGRLLVVNFWATWCAPCREEMPLFVKAQAEHGARGLQFVGIAVDEVGKVKRFADEIGLNYPALIGGYGAMELSKTLGNEVMALPYTIAIDPAGKVIANHLGPVKPDDLQRIIRRGLPAS